MSRASTVVRCAGPSLVRSCRVCHSEGRTMTRQVSRPGSRRRRGALAHARQTHKAGRHTELGVTRDVHRRVVSSEALGAHCPSVDFLMAAQSICCYRDSVESRKRHTLPAVRRRAPACWRRSRDGLGSSWRTFTTPPLEQPSTADVAAGVTDSLLATTPSRGRAPPIAPRSAWRVDRGVVHAGVVLQQCIRVEDQWAAPTRAAIPGCPVSLSTAVDGSS